MAATEPQKLTYTLFKEILLNQENNLYRVFRGNRIILEIKRPTRTHRFFASILEMNRRHNAQGRLIFDMRFVVFPTRQDLYNPAFINQRNGTLNFENDGNEFPLHYLTINTHTNSLDFMDLTEQEEDEDENEDEETENDFTINRLTDNNFAITILPTSDHIARAHQQNVTLGRTLDRFQRQAISQPTRAAELMREMPFHEENPNERNSFLRMAALGPAGPMQNVYSYLRQNPREPSPSFTGGRRRRRSTRRRTRRSRR